MVFAFAGLSTITRGLATARRVGAMTRSCVNHPTRTGG